MPQALDQDRGGPGHGTHRSSEPVLSLKIAEHDSDDPDYEAPEAKITPAPLKLGYILEVHAVDTCHKGKE